MNTNRFLYLTRRIELYKRPPGPPEHYIFCPTRRAMEENKDEYPDATTYLEVRPWVVCKDGFKVSIQASKNHYCEPRTNFPPDDEYISVELGFPNMVDSLILPYAEDPEEPTGTVYGQVPVEIVDKMLKKHGGIVDVQTEDDRIKEVKS